MVGNAEAVAVIVLCSLLLPLERTGIEPVTSDLQTHPIARPHLTPTDKIGMTERKSLLSANLAQRRSTAVRSHRARIAAA